MRSRIRGLILGRHRSARISRRRGPVSARGGENKPGRLHRCAIKPRPAAEGKYFVPLLVIVGTYQFAGNK